MPARWYYINEGGVVGPITAAELTYLMNQGTIGASSLVRGNDDGAWVAAGTITTQLESGGEAGSADGPATEIPQWHFNRKGQSKQGPVTWSALKSMMDGGQLQADDLLWKPGMAMWAPASQVSGLLAESCPAPAREPGLLGRIGLRGGSRARRAGAALMLLFALITAIAGGMWLRNRSRDLMTGAEKNASAVSSSAKGGVKEVERWLDEARSAVRLEQLDRAARLLDQYLADPRAIQIEAAKLLSREIKLAASMTEAAALGQTLGDQPLKAYLRDGVESLVATIETAELRPIYERTLLQAFRQENNRRQLVPKVPFAQAPNPVDAELIPKNQDEPAIRPVEANPQPGEDVPRLAHRLGPMAADLNAVMDKPDAFMGKTLLLNGLFKVGTKISEVKGEDGQALGRSLPVARNDDRAVFTGDRKVEKQDVVMLLDDRLSSFLERIFNKLRLKTTIKPSYKCILTVTIRRLLVNGSPAPVVVISSMEVLGGCDYLSVARHQYSQAFRTLTVTPGEAVVDFGDGDRWVERLGGEENFVQPIRRKFREMQRRAVTNRDSAVIDAILQRELVKVVNTASAINHIVAMEGLKRMRIWP